MGVGKLLRYKLQAWHKLQGTSYKAQATRYYKASVNSNMLRNSSMPTVDRAMVDGFDDLAKRRSWWDTSSDNKMIHMLSINNARVPYIIETLIEYGDLKVEDTSKPLEELTILDVGCGCGIFAEALAKMGASVTGIDPAGSAIERAIEHAQLDGSLKGRLQYKSSTIEEFSTFNADLYDVVIVAHVIDFVVNPAYFLKLCCAKVKPGGAIHVEAKNRTLTAFFTLIWRQYITREVQRGLYNWRKHRTPQEVEEILKNNGFDKIKIMGQELKKNTNTYEINGNTDMNYNITAMKTF